MVIQFSNVASVSGAIDVDRQIRVDNSGRVVFAEYNGSQQEIVSTGAYTDNAWHLVDVSQSPTVTTLYDDGTAVGTMYNITPQAYSGYWHIGGGLIGWNDGPANAYFQGSLSRVAVWDTTALTASQVAAHWAAR